jgi:hypothetical protein
LKVGFGAGGTNGICIHVATIHLEIYDGNPQHPTSWRQAFSLAQQTQIAELQIPHLVNLCVGYSCSGRRAVKNLLKVFLLARAENAQSDHRQAWIRRLSLRGEY